MSDVDENDSLNSMDQQQKIHHLSLTDLHPKGQYTMLSPEETGETIPESKATETGGNNKPTGHPLNRTMNSTSELATKRRIEKETNLQMLSMKQQLENVESKNLELIKAKKKLTQEVEQKTREVKFLERQVYEQQNEIQHLKSQLDSAVRITQKTHVSTSSKHYHQQHKSSQPSEISKLAEEIKHLQENLAMKQKENQAIHQTNQELQMKIKILQDALTFRSEEIGLSGHADLLTKVAQLKGEVVALKKELLNKVSMVETMVQDKQQLIIEQSNLQEQISTIQQRLAKSQQDAYRYTNNDIGLLLKTTEQERDLLLEYIQQDMNKNISLTKQIESLESELRITHQKYSFLEKSLEEKQQLLDYHQQSSHQLEQEQVITKEEVKELKQQVDQYSYELETCQKQLHRKQLETDEHTKIQATLYSQLRAKDEELLRKSEEIIQYKTKIQEFESNHPSLVHEIQHLRENQRKLDEELKNYKDTLQVVEPKVQQLEPLVSMLQEELSQQSQKMKVLEQENYQYRQSYELLQNLQRDLMECENRPLKLASSISTSSTPKRPNKSPGIRFAMDLPSPSRYELPREEEEEEQKDTVTGADHDYLSCSQQHAQWIGLPSLRNLHPKLYEKIRSLSQDLYKVEVDYHQLLQQNQLQQQDQVRVQNELKDQLQQANKQIQYHQDRSQQYYQQMISLEKQVLQDREKEQFLLQIKTILKAYPRPKLSSSTRMSNNPADDNPSASKSNHLSFIQALKATQTESTPDPLSASYKKGEVVEEDKDLLIVDQLLPEYLQQLLLQYTQIAYAYHETMESLEVITKDNLLLKERHAALVLQNNRTEQELQEIKQYTSSKDHQYISQERQYYQSMEQATELTEKQNLLIISLQGKVESLYRDRQLQKAQLHALQQREDTVKQRLLQQLEQEYSAIYQELIRYYPHFQSNQISLQEILSLLLERVQAHWHDRERVNSTTAITGNYASTGYNHPDHIGMDPPTMKRSVSPPAVPVGPISSYQTAMNNNTNASRPHHPTTELRQTYPFPDRVPIHSNPTSASTVTVSRDARKYQPDLTNSKTEGVTLSNNVASQMLQERLKKAQQAFASMKTSLI